ncbi:MAG: hypothetical protein EBS75_08035 [Betaproteobacteria bacterium]|nr:hypothetical protein [Betaproteobacteria bacterium]
MNASTTALISITLSEASATFDANDLKVSGGTITSFGGTGSTNYTAIFTPAVGYTGVGGVEIPVGVFGDAAGNLSTSVYALPLPLTVDTVAPLPGKLAFGSDFSDTGQSASDRVTNDTQFSLVYVPASQIVPGLSNPTDDGNWSYVFMASVDGSNWVNAPVGTLSSISLDLAALSLPDLQYYFRALVADGAGNTVLTPTLDYRLDRSPPSPAGSLVFGDDFSDTGSSSTDRITNDNAFSLSLTGAETGASPLGLLTVDLPDGTDSNFVTAGNGITIGELRGGIYQVSLASEGSYVFRAVLEDIAGNTAFAGTIAMFYRTDAPYRTDGTANFMRNPTENDTSSQGGAETPADRSFDLGFGAQTALVPASESAEAHAVKLGEALVAYISPPAELSPVQSSAPLDFPVLQGSAIGSVSGLATALSEYQSTHYPVMKESAVLGLFDASEKPGPLKLSSTLSSPVDLTPKSGSG